MFATSRRGEGQNLTYRPTVARRQLQASLGAIVVIALVAMAATVSLRGSSSSGQTALNAPNRAPIVKTTARETPSKRMQATDQAKSGRGI